MLAGDLVADRLQAEAQDRLGLDLIAQGKIGEAVAAFERAVQADPCFPSAHLDLGAALRLAGKRAEAIEALRKAIAVQPEYPAALYNLGSTLLETGDLPGAYDAFQKTAALEPGYSLAYGGMGMVLMVGNNPEKARDSFKKALDLAPGFHLASHFLGLAHWACGDTEAAIATYREGLRHDPTSCADCHFNLSLALLRRGEYGEGWREYEWRWRPQGEIPRMEGLSCPAWDGSPLDGKTILLWVEQGLGDILQFVRFATLVHERGGTVCLLSRPNLDRLLATCPGIARVSSNPEELRDVDYQLPLASLPRALGVTLEDLPAVGVPYLRPPAPRMADPFGPRRGGELRVGVVWGVEPGQPHYERRSCPLPGFRALESVPGVELYSLQFGSLSAELRRPDAPRMVDLSGVLGDFANTAALIDWLDLIITVDTSMAHLAGAIGKRVWMLLPRDSDWRWLGEREDSPWYPTMRLFRQEEGGRWEPVVGKVVSALQAALTAAAD